MRPPPVSPFPLRPHRGFIGRFWHGELPLAVSFWLVGLGVLLSVAALLAGLVLFMRRQDFNPYQVMTALATIWGGGALTLLLLSVGIWRSASRHRFERRTAKRWTGWATTAQATMALLALALAGGFARYGAADVYEGWRMAFQGDPDIPPYSIRLMRDGREAEIIGGFKFGLAKSAERLFASAPDLKVVHLNSGGGRLGEAIALARLIRARGLSTYTSASCASACTIAFMAGRERLLLSGAKLGFHRAFFGASEYGDAMGQLLSEGGATPAFVALAMTHPATTIWYPTEPELQAGKVITATVDFYRFAASGLGVQPTLEDFKAELRRVREFAAIEAADPRIFADTAELYERLFAEGASAGRISDEIRVAKFQPLLRQRLPLANDTLMVGYASLMADQYDLLATDPDLCYEVATRVSGTQSTRLMPAPLQERGINLSDQVLRSTTRRLPPTPDQLTEAGMALSQALIAKFGANNVRLLANPLALTERQHGAFCQLYIGMFRAIAQLPPPQAGTLMADMFGKMAAASQAPAPAKP
ncbi:MAG TPA: hypothetical protein VMI56_11815 [Reyranella sp.]|nr:hypothetical protein [Reyranella sp.]